MNNNTVAHSGVDRLLEAATLIESDNNNAVMSSATTPKANSPITTECQALARKVNHGPINNSCDPRLCASFCLRMTVTQLKTTEESVTVDRSKSSKVQPPQQKLTAHEILKLRHKCSNTARGLECLCIKIKLEPINPSGSNQKNTQATNFDPNFLVRKS